MRRVVAELPQDRPAKPEFSRDVVRDPEIAAALRRFYRLAEGPKSSLLERQAHLLKALVLLVGRHGLRQLAPRPLGREPNAVRLSREYLQEHAAENVSLEALARQAGLSAFHLCRVFRQAVGITPHAYQTQLRVRRAKSLLRAGLPIATVAVQTGFYDQAHLTRLFKRLVGLPPGRYISDAAT
jgi:transcriptional regulator GlxA family with amidase domain